MPICSLEDQTALSIADLRLSFLVSPQIIISAPNLPVVEELQGFSLELPVQIVLLAQQQSLVVQRKPPFLLPVLKHAGIAVLVRHEQTSLPVVQFLIVETFVSQVSRSQILLSIHAHHLVILHFHAQHALVRLVIVVQPLIVVVVLEEQIDLVLVPRSLVLVIVIIQQRHRFVVSVPRQIVEVVHDTSAHLRLSTPRRSNLARKQAEKVQNDGDSPVVVGSDENFQQFLGVCAEDKRYANEDFT